MATGLRVVSASAKVNTRVLQWMTGAVMAHPDPHYPLQWQSTTPKPAQREPLSRVLRFPGGGDGVDQDADGTDEDDIFGGGVGDVDDYSGAGEALAEAPLQYEWHAI